MHEHRVVRFSLGPDQVPKPEHLRRARRALLFAERKDLDVLGKVIGARELCDHCYFFTMFRKFLDPSMEEPENWISTIDLLRDDQEFHTDDVEEIED